MAIAESSVVGSVEGAPQPAASGMSQEELFLAVYGDWTQTQERQVGNFVFVKPVGDEPYVAQCLGFPNQDADLDEPSHMPRVLRVLAYAEGREETRSFSPRQIESLEPAGQFVKQFLGLCIFDWMKNGQPSPEQLKIAANYGRTLAGNR